MTTKKLNIDILARDKSRQALSQVQTRLGNLKKSVFSLQSAFVGLGAGLVVKSFVDVGKEVESLQVRFKFLFGSAEEGAVAFDNLSKFAGRVPFSLEEISRASGNLAVVADDANDLNRILEITGNVAAVTGLDFETTSSQIQRAFSGGIGAADLFRERGVRALLGFQAGAKVTAEETIARFEELFSGNGQFASATKDLATTLEGTLSMIGDKYFNFQKDVAAGFFDELKGEFGDLNKFLEANEQQIKDIATAIGENFAGALTTTSDLIKDVAPAVKIVANALGTTIEGFKSLPTFVQSSGLIAALLFGKKGMLAFAGVSFLLGQIDSLIEKTREIATEKSLLDALGAGEIDAFTLSLEEIDSLIEHIGNTSVHGTIPLGEREAATELFKILQNVRSQLINTNNTIEHSAKVGNEMANAFNSISIQAKNSNEQLKEMTRTTNRIVVMGGMVGEEFEKALGSIGEGVDVVTESKFPRFKQVLEDAGNTTKQLDGLFTNTFNSFADTLAKSIMTGKFAFKDFARSVIADIARIIARQQALIAVQKIAGLFGGGSFLGGLLPGRSSGGRVNAGMPVMVGEAGREVFVPQSSGTIVPNNQVSGSTNINFTINTVDAQGVDELLTNRRSTIINVINDALNRQGKEALV
jgi:hypothetical protein|tara:strand:+ start:509 stop:2434 length:1926 start_codon:yes stop_codon:yes gene_type:complete